MIEIREYDDIEHPELARAWSALEGAGACPHVFLSAAWFLPWARRFAGDMRPVLLAGFDAEGAAGIAPFLRTPAGRLELPVNYVSQRGGFIALPERPGDKPGSADPFRDAVFRRLAGRRERLLLRSLTADEAGATSTAARSAGLLLNRLPARVSPYVETAGSWDEFLEGKPRKVTHEWERKIRKLERAGSCEVKRPVPGSDPHALVDSMIEIEQRSWKEESGTSITARGVSDFYHELVDSFASSPPPQSEFLPFWIELDGRPIGFLLGIAYRGTYFALKTSFDEEFRSLAPGVALFHRAIHYAFERGFSCFDFVGERARWKDEWATGHTEHTTLRLYPGSLGGVTRYIVDTHLKRIGKRVVGEGER
jgi:CelD/BcsL family acetyltransferase involved in cellulose biosynthesis